MKSYYISIKEELQEEKKFYAEELRKTDWEYLKEASELFLIHAYSHLFKTSLVGNKLSELIGSGDYRIEVFGDDEYKIKYGQFYLNLAVGLELLLKSILLKKGVTIHLDSGRTISFRVVITQYSSKIFPKLSEITLEEIKDTLKLINLRRNNIAHRSKRSHDSYLHEHRFSYVTLYIYEEFFHGENTELIKLLLKSVNRSKLTTGADFKPLRITPRSLRRKSSPDIN